MLFQTPQSEKARAIFDESRQLQTMLDFERALARAEAHVGLIPATDAETIGRFCSWDLFDLKILSKASAMSGNVAIPMIQQLCALVKEGSPGSESYVHWGATSQDVIDTGVVLQIREMLLITEIALCKVCADLASLCEIYANTPMAGRTWLQHAVPITFGFKIACSLDAMLRHADRLNEVKRRVLVLQFGGAVGTLASIGEHGQKVAAELARALDLDLPAVPWHTHRDRVVEVASFYGILMVTIGKIARDLSLMMQTEVGEVSEPHVEGKGGSSTMPQKQNPVASATILADAIRVPGLISTILVAASSQEHERGLGGWQVEWKILPELCITVQGAFETLIAVLEGLRVDPDAMRTNIDKTFGLIFAEAVSMALAQRIGKHQAHALVERVTKKTRADKSDLRTVLLEDLTIQKHFSDDEIDQILDPMRYMGSIDVTIRAVLDAYRTRYGLR